MSDLDRNALIRAVFDAAFRMGYSCGEDHQSAYGCGSASFKPESPSSAWAEAVQPELDAGVKIDDPEFWGGRHL